MKNFLILIVIAAALQSCSQKTQVQTSTSVNAPLLPNQTMVAEADIPEPVVSRWRTEYPQLHGAQWYKSDKGYTVYYLHKGLQQRVEYDEKGTGVWKSHELKPEAVPLTIRESMKAKYPGIQYGRTYVGYPEKGIKRYEVEVNGKWEAFDGEGKPVK